MTQQQAVTTEQLQARIDELEARAAMAESRVEALLDTAQLFALRFVVSDKHGDIIAQRGLAEPALEDRGASDRVGEALFGVLALAKSTGHRADQTIQLIGPPLRTVAISAIPILDVDGTFCGAIGAVRDITDGDDVDTGRQEFVANLSHELKTPIGALGLLAETLLVEHDPTVTERLIRRMHTEAVRVGQVIDDLLNLSRMESSIPTEFEELAARSIVESAINRVRYTAEHRHIGISVQGDIAATVYGADRELVSAIHHLLENALKYSPSNSTVDVAVTTDNLWTHIAVQDHGVGIAPQYLDRIFDRFYRVDNARTRSTGGTGLGLAIVRRVVHNHGGEVQVTSEDGKGSTFTLRLAARRAQDTGRASGGSHG